MPSLRAHIDIGLPYEEMQRLIAVLQSVWKEVVSKYPDAVMPSPKEDVWHGPAARPFFVEVHGTNEEEVIAIADLFVAVVDVEAYAPWGEMVFQEKGGKFSRRSWKYTPRPRRGT